MKRLIITALLLTSGCFQATLRTHKPEGMPHPQFEQKWHHGFVGGLVDGTGPMMLDEACPEGVSKIESQTSFLNYLVGGITYGVYSPQEVTIKCARGTPRPPVRTDAASQAEPTAPKKSVFDDRWTD